MISRYTHKLEKRGVSCLIRRHQRHKCCPSLYAKCALHFAIKTKPITQNDTYLSNQSSDPSLCSTSLHSRCFSFHSFLSANTTSTVINAMIIHSKKLLCL
jgi:hypothetical protein